MNQSDSRKKINQRPRKHMSRRKRQLILRIRFISFFVLFGIIILWKITSDRSTKSISAHPDAEDPTAAHPDAEDPVVADSVSADPVAAHPGAAHPFAAHPFAADFDIMADNVVEGVEIESITSDEITTEAETEKTTNTISPNDKLIAITFDDGPHETVTSTILDILGKEDVKATFFLLGSSAVLYPDVVKQIANGGHQIGSHTTNHMDLTRLSLENMQREINDTMNIIESITGVKPSVLRPPYGAYNQQVLDNANAAVILWSVDSEDWKHKDAKLIRDNVVNNVKDGDIILLHDIHETTAQAIETIIQKLKEEYTFVTVDELINARGEAIRGIE